MYGTGPRNVEINNIGRVYMDLDLAPDLKSGFGPKFSNYTLKDVVSHNFSKCGIPDIVIQIVKILHPNLHER